MIVSGLRAESISINHVSGVMSIHEQAQPWVEGLPSLQHTSDLGHMPDACTVTLSGTPVPAICIIIEEADWQCL